MQFLQGPPCVTPDVSRELALSQVLVLPEAKPPVEKVLEPCVEVTINQATIINTTIVRDGEAVRKVIVKGDAEITVKYAADVPDQQVHAAVFCIPFETLIEWVGGPPPGSPICVYVTVEHFQVDSVDPESLLGILVIRLDIFNR